jgi:acetyl esterase/lipase
MEYIGDLKMIIEKKKVWGGKRQAAYTMYLLDNSSEIDSGKKHPAIIICGGGGFMRISEREKQPVAMYFLNNGYQVFVLDYITKSTGIAYYPGPVTDLAKMVMTIRENAEQWDIDSNKIAIIGFSAGGQICASLATQWNSELLINKVDPQADPELFRPNAVILCYPLLDYLYQIERGNNDNDSNGFSPSIGMRKNDFIQMFLEAGVGVNATEEQYRNASPLYHVSDRTPPTFIWHTAQDELIYAEQSLQYAAKLGEHHVPYEIHIFEEGAHGLSMATENSTSNPELINNDVSIWAELALKFLKRHLR